MAAYILMLPVIAVSIKKNTWTIITSYNLTGVLLRSVALASSDPVNSLFKIFQFTKTGGCNQHIKLLVRVETSIRES